MFKFNYKIKISLSTVQAYLLALSPILHMYRFISIVTWGEVALCIAVVLGYRAGGYCVKQPKTKIRIMLLIGYFVLSTLIGTMLWNGSLFNAFKEVLVFGVYYIIAFILMQRVDLSVFLRVLQKVALITACLVIIQFIAFALFGVYVSGLIPNVTTYFGNSTNLYIGRASSRCAGFFTEPAMCARFMAIPFGIRIAEIIKENKKIIDSL